MSSYFKSSFFFGRFCFLDNRSDRCSTVRYTYVEGHTVNSLQDGHLWDRHYVSVLERCPSYKESNKAKKQKQGPTLGVRFTEVSVLWRCPLRESSATRLYDQNRHNNRFCPVCSSGVIEDEFHFLLHCPKYLIPREKVFNQIQHYFVHFNQLSSTELLIKLLNSQNFSLNSHLLKFVSLCNDLRNKLLSNHTDDI